MNIKQTLMPFLAWIGELKNPKVLRADIIAGITVALVLVPQSMAYAQLAGLPAYHGLYASFLPGMIAALFGSSRQLATGPVAVVSLMTASALEPIAAGSPENYLAYAVLLALMVGVFQIALGLFRMGVLVDFLSHPVVMGFTNAAALIIGTSQIGKLFGVSVEKSERTYETVWNTLVAASQDAHMMTVYMAVLALGIMIILKKVAPKAPAVLISVVITTIVSWMMNLEEKGVKVVGNIPEGLPAIAMPNIDMDIATHLLGTAIAISLIGFMEAISIAKAMAAQTRQRLDSNQELVGQGLSNLASAFSSGYAVSGSFSRSAVNISAGAVTGFSAIVTGLVVAITLLWLTPLLYHLPQATLASVIIMAVINLIKFSPIMAFWKVQKHDAIVSVITFCLTILWAPHLDKGIMVGVVLSLGLYIFRSMRPRIAELSRSQDGTLRDAGVHELETCEHISVIRFDGSLYFANAGYFEEMVLQNVASKPEVVFVIIDFEGINSIDASGEEMLHMLAQRLQSNGVEILLARVKKQLMDVFCRTGFVQHQGADHFFRLRTDALEHAFARLKDRHSDETCPIKVAMPVGDEEKATDDANCADAKH